jgi:hypothetical protein
VRHEAEYPDRPKFTATELADWTRTYKRVDVEHPKPERNSFQALVGRQIVGRNRVIHAAVYFVAYTKDHGIIEVISIRFADTSERAIFFRQTVGQSLANQAGFPAVAARQPYARPDTGSGCPGSSRVDRARHARQPGWLRPRPPEAYRRPTQAVQASVIRACSHRRTRPPPDRTREITPVRATRLNLDRAAKRRATTPTRAQ